ncbi:hypothetical protein ACLB2K_035140 [Fragaria x ananassa]
MTRYLYSEASNDYSVSPSGAMNAPPFLFSGDPWGQPPPPPPQPQPLPLNPNFLIQSSLNLYTYLSSLASFTPHYRPAPPPNYFPIQNPSFAPNRFSISEYHPPLLPPLPPPSPPPSPPPHPPSSPPPSPPPPPPSPQNPKQRLERIDRAVETARSDLIAAGEGVSAWKVTQSAIRILKVDCWSDLEFSMQQVPSLHSLMLIEGKINAFIHCFVGVRRIASLYDLEVAICKNEGIEQFEELGLGPLLQNPLVGHYFSVKCDATEVFKITKEDLGIRIHSLGVHISAIRVARDLESAALKKSGELIIQKADSRCTKGPPRMQQNKDFTTSVHKQFCGKHTRFDSDDDGSDAENKDHVRGNQVNVSSQAALISDRVDSEDGLVVSPSQSKGQLSQVNLTSQTAGSSDRVNSDDGLVVSPSQSKGQFPLLKMQQDKGSSTISCRVESYFSVRNQFCGKHIRFDSPENSENEGGDDDLHDEEDCNSDQVTCSLVNFLSQSGGRSDRVSSCPYPSAMEEIQRLGLDQLSSDSGSQKHKETIGSIKKKRKSEDLAITIYVPPKLRKTENSENEGGDDDLYDEEDCDCDQVTCSLVNLSSQSGGRSDRVSSCPYPSVMEEIQRLGLDQLPSDSGSQKHKETIDSAKMKRKSEDLAITIYVPPKLRKTEKVEQVALPIENGMQANNVRNLDRNKGESWPPVDWRTAPRYNACANGFRTQLPILNPRSDLQKKREDNYNRSVRHMDKMIPITGTPQCGSSNFGKRDRLSTCTPDAIQAKETGRLGELAVFKYFIDKAGKSAVKWVNEHRETRLPYDIIVDNEGRREFIEVKATRNPTKDWFEMSVRQLQFAVEQGEAFSIAHVILSDNDAATVRIYNNLEKLLMKHNNQELQDQDCKLNLSIYQILLSTVVLRKESSIKSKKGLVNSVVSNFVTLLDSDIKLGGIRC